jgi:hypothetical protein
MNYILLTRYSYTVKLIVRAGEMAEVLVHLPSNPQFHQNQKPLKVLSPPTFPNTKTQQCQQTQALF